MCSVIYEIETVSVNKQIILNVLWNTFTKCNSTVFTSHVTEVVGVNRSGCGVDPSSPSSAEVKEILELYLYFHYGPPSLVVGWTSTLIMKVNWMWLHALW
jgi:hypothetical protein